MHGNRQLQNSMLSIFSRCYPLFVAPYPNKVFEELESQHWCLISVAVFF